MKSVFIPVPVMVGATVIIATRLLEFVLILNLLGVDGVVEFIRACSATWFNSLILLASLLIVMIECQCAFAMTRARNWGRKAFIICQITVICYLLLASFEWFVPKIFLLEPDEQGHFINDLLLQKIPDILVLLLLYLPASSRRFFLPRR
ncbi:YbjO family protein [Rouxiella sp. Mn2063]|uniref:YbjO family protein n=1 Tax=Rouxiella sp. Mn2063 TaxID=3395262 RepID=UPI003BD8B655